MNKQKSLGQGFCVNKGLETPVCIMLNNEYGVFARRTGIFMGLPNTFRISHRYNCTKSSGFFVLIILGSQKQAV